MYARNFIKIIQNHVGKSSDLQFLSTAVVAAQPKDKLKMCGWQIHSYGDLDELQYTDSLRIPQIRSSNECLVKVNATTVNPIDVSMLGGYGSKLLNLLRCKVTDIEFPLVLGREFSGTLQQKGMGSNKNLNCGDRVWGVVPIHSVGSHAEYVTVPDYCISRLPPDLSDEEAASVLYAGLTAWSGLYISAGLGDLFGAITASGGGSNKKVLVLGGSGGVGSIAIQILKSQNSTVFSTCSTDAVPLLTELGTDCVIDYSNAKQMETLKNCSPFDIVLDCSGQGQGYADTHDFSFKQYITFSSPLLKNVDNSGIPFGLLKNLADLVESNVKSISTKQGCVKWGFFVPAPQGIEFLRILCERKKLRPIIDSTFNFEQLPDAFSRVQQGHLRGKVVVKVK